MNDEHLDKILEQARGAYNRPPAPDLDALWTGIQSRRRHVNVSRSRGAGWWATRAVGVAAALVMAFALGRFTAADNMTVTVSPSAVTVAAETVEQPVTRVTTELLGETVVLLASLPEERSGSVPDTRFIQQAGALLTTTRVLLDSPAAAGNPQLHNLLEDLELVLAQIARLQRGGQSRVELELITEALQQQDLVPRIRSIAAGLNAGDD